MRLLKIGTLNIPSTRWLDALDVFDQIDVLCLDTEKKVINKNIHYFTIDSKGFINRNLITFIKRFAASSCMSWMCEFFIIILRIVNNNLFNNLKRVNYDYVHSSYNDFDESAMLTCALRPKKYIRAQKETRPPYSYLEKKAFEHASSVVLNDKLNLDFYKQKYGKDFLNEKNILFGLDEDVRSKKIASRIKYSKKLSENDGKVHAVILAGRVLCNPNDARSGGRLYYVYLIKELLKNNIVVHLHTGNIVSYKRANPYLKLSNQNKNFIIEDSLDFVNNTIEAYYILSVERQIISSAF